ncbi:molybdenum cofactor biosynthesis protein MoaE [Companilactobacillus allii]|uniref:Molybdenum cofactor biosynthesis protein E n=1 Tax=Companilactobacillus allii TaxID=1847728 RepID=A0A1P8Q4C4_9LACO|nr:molybdenum cofactor biosynthesis protein MoaE [Companilactobacillus allii]APX72673.1 molybdenum cofactor biosynthesis protein E [Companilactobacillus allii]USQ69777.1 molybdenum cofactor biosynthesis protein MoaE [Companilactobacillus allii]
MKIEITQEPINTEKLTQSLIHSEYGGVDIFIGNIRRFTDDIETEKIEYTTYKKMAEKEMQKLADKVLSKGMDVVMVHRIGELQLGDIAVFIGVSAPHRAEAFENCQFLIDELKKTVPIWKKEYDRDKIRWGGLED